MPFVSGKYIYELITEISWLLKKFQMLGVEKQGVRRTFLYDAMTSDEDNNADGIFSTTSSGR